MGVGAPVMLWMGHRSDGGCCAVRVGAVLTSMVGLTTNTSLDLG